MFTGYDLIFFAAIAVFLAWKLYSVLGRRTGNERSIDPFATPPNQPGAKGPTQLGKPGDATVRPGAVPDRQPENTAAAPEERQMARREQRQLEALVTQAPEPVRKGLEAIRGADREFDPIGFLAGAKVAFEMILQAFAAGDANALKPLLAPDVLQNFSAAITARQRDKLTVKFTLVGIIGLEILDAELKGPDARIKLRFNSEQVNVTQDSEGRIVEGHPNEVASITDIWTFSRPVTSRDPNWVLIATESPH
ncbi:MAG TPA: Tim44/TimA family putative adaptor protein [Dongiaceae bacterium]|nr:Tim44/TimA family putative adaptor protein [Dongiaceae bacterium]